MNEPDGFIGAVMAMEGIIDATALLHGQNGCRKGLILSQKMCPRTDRDTDIPVYNGNPTVPYSNINQGDYTGKSYGKLQKAAQYVANEDYRLTALICSPGISIVGDDCARILRESNMPGDTMMLDSSEMGENVWTGFDKTVRACLGKVCTENLPIRKDTVVVTGLSIMHKDWTSFEEELTEMLGAMGLEIICFAGAGCTVQDLKDSVCAEYCIDISPEFSTETRSFYKDNGTKMISFGCSPVGFDSVEGFYRNIAEKTGGDFSFVMEHLSRMKDRAYRCVIASSMDLRGRTFCVSAPPSMKDPLSKFLEESFGMLHAEERYEYLFAEGNRCAMEKASGRCPRCIDIGFPSNKVDFNRNPVLGMYGTMYLLDSLFL